VARTGLACTKTTALMLWLGDLDSNQHPSECFAVFTRTRARHLRRRFGAFVRAGQIVAKRTLDDLPGPKGLGNIYQLDSTKTFG
jgi:hypothetical protein